MKFLNTALYLGSATPLWTVADQRTMHSNIRGTRDLQNLPQPPNVDQVTYGVNVLLGIPPSGQRDAFIGSKLFDLTEAPEQGNENTYFQYDQFSEMNTAGQCYYRGIEEQVWYSTSTSSLRSQEQESTHGFDREVDLGVEIPIGGATASAETTMRTALVFGNSRSSSNAISKKKSGFTHSFDVNSQRTLYSVEVDYDNVDTWTDAFLDACTELGDEPDTKQVLNLIQNFGSHGLATADFGQVCTASLFIESDQTTSAYYDIHSEKQNFEASLLWWTSSTSSSTSDEEGKSNLHGYRYQISDRHCRGELLSDSNCGGGMQGSGRDTDRPAIVKWSYKPVWEMPIPTLTQGARDKMKAVFTEILEASVRCSENHCNSNGACAPNLENWGMVDEFDMSGAGWELDDLLDGSKCFCFHEYEGDSCETGRSIRTSNPMTQSNYANDFDGTLDFSDGNPICGVNSYHDSGHEDRRFQFSTCPIKESGGEYGTQSGEQVLPLTLYDQPFTLLCEEDKVLTRLHSYHNNNHEDRRWTGTCTHFKNTVTANCEGFDTFENSYDGSMDFYCSTGKVLTGIYSEHSNHNEDRRFKFRCCELMHGVDDAFALTKSDWSDYQNNFDESLSATWGSPGQKDAFCGVSSYHDNDHEDRRFRFKTCQMPSNPASTQTLDSGYTNDWDQASTVECPNGSFLSAVYSYHDSHHEDRRFKYTCDSWQGYATDMCFWSDYVNSFDEGYDFECGEKFVLTGIDSYHNSDAEDRKFKFRCCRVILA